MTKKDYILLAKVFAEFSPDRLVDYEANIAIGDLLRVLATRLEIDNPRFDRQRFLIACGYNS